MLIASGFERKQERLKVQNHGVHEPEGIHDVKNYSPQGAGVF